MYDGVGQWVVQGGENVHSKRYIGVNVSVIESIHDSVMC